MSAPESAAVTPGQAVRERLLSRLIIDPVAGCLLWTGAATDDGYGAIKISSRMLPVHRVMYEMFAGPIPEGMQLDHLCRVRRCANVAHLEPVTLKVNVLRGESFSAVNSRKEACINGHPFDLVNVYWRENGWRGCRQCRRDREARRVRRAPAKRTTPEVLA